MRNTAYKYRIYPNAEQEAFFVRTFGCCRKVWNLMLSDKTDHYREHKKMLHNTPAQYKDAYPFLREADSLALANTQLQLEAAFRNFFRDKRTGFPRFKSKRHPKQSYTTNNQNGTVSITDGHIRLPKTGPVKAVIHREAPEGWKLKSVTVSRNAAGEYYASVLYECDTAAMLPPAPAGSAIGLDYKSDGLYMDSDGHAAGMPKYYRDSQKKLAKAQRVLSRRQGAGKGEQPSANFLKQKLKLARIHGHAANQRKDFLHKESTAIAKRYETVCVEDLDMRAMSNKGFGNGKATLDNGYGMFLSMLDYKLRDRGGRLIKVGKYYPSSQLCSRCGKRHPMPLSERVYVCPVCGMVMDRDHNAAANILHEGIRMLAEA